MAEFLIFLLSLAVGVVGYLLATFWMQPIVHYLQLKQQVASDLVFYANAFNFRHGSPAIKQRAEERVSANRRHAADLVACHNRLPAPYRWLLRRRRENPSRAASELLRISNQSNASAAEPMIRTVEQCLRFPRMV
jgi:hypothetical protein